MTGPYASRFCRWLTAFARRAPRPACCKARDPARGDGRLWAARVNEGIPPLPPAGVRSESFPLHFGSLTGKGSQEQAVTTGEGTHGRSAEYVTEGSARPGHCGSSQFGLRPVGLRPAAGGSRPTRAAGKGTGPVSGTTRLQDGGVPRDQEPSTGPPLRCKERLTTSQAFRRPGGLAPTGGTSKPVGLSICECL